MSGASPGARSAPRVTTVLESLAVQRASGVLEIDGDPAGVIYLDQGQVTYAQASWVPDLAARFCASQRPRADVRALLLGDDPDRDPGTVLLSCVSRAELQALLRSVIVDAIIALTVPLAGSAVSGIRFEAPRAHWASAFARLPLDSVREEAVCRAARLARYQVSRSSAVSLRDMDQGSMVLTREQWAIASRIGRTSTVRDLAWRSGLALCDTIECVGRLIRAGLCTLVASPGSNVPAGAPPSAPDAPGAAEPGDEPVMLSAPGVPEPLPRRRPGIHLAKELRAAAAQSGVAVPRPAQAVPASYTPPSPDVLLRLLDGLRNLA
jgi:Domain of unknown function (DUF4388)